MQPRPAAVQRTNELRRSQYALAVRLGWTSKHRSFIYASQTLDYPPGRFAPDWVADLTGIRTGVMSRGLRLFEERLAEEKELRRWVDGLRRVMRGQEGENSKKARHRMISLGKDE